MRKTISSNILFCGRGGQGVLTAAEVVGWAALFEGYHVKKSEVHGMAQRGGSVESHLRFGRRVSSPLIPLKQADYLVSFDENEAARLRGFLRRDGVDLLPTLVEAHRLLADKRFLNIFLAGRLSRYLTITEANWDRAIRQVFASKRPEENRRIFCLGRGGGL